MRVLHVIPGIETKDGGPSQAIVPMCQSLRDLGVDVTLATTCFTDDWSSKISVEGIPTLFFKSAWGESFKYSRSIAVWLDQNVENFDVVHVHAVFNHSSVAAAQACHKHHVPYIVRPLGSLNPWSMKQKEWKKSLFWKLYGRSMCTRSAAMHYTAAEEKCASEESLGLNHGVVIPLGIQASSSEAELDQDRFDLRTPYVLVLSRLLPSKGISILMDAFFDVTKTLGLSNWSLVIAGDGPADFVSELRQIAKAREGSTSVLFTGWLESQQKTAALKKAALLALPSHHENFGLCVLEAMAEGVPVLVSSHVGLAGEISSHDAGWVVEVERIAISKALAEAFSNDELRMQRGTAARELSRDFEWKIVGKQLEKLYSSVISNDASI